MLDTSVAHATTSCSVKLQQNVRPWLPDTYQGATRCTKITANYKVRPVLIRTGQPDKKGAYFTKLNTWYGTGYHTAPFGRSAAYEVRGV